MRSPEEWSALHEGRLERMVSISQAAGQSTLAHFRQSELAVEAKADDSPVTAADRAAEQMVRKQIAEAFPADEVVGEEYERQPGSSGYRWIVDPIDGTKSFVAGVPLYSTLLAVEQGDQPVGGVIYIPAVEECVAAARGQGAWYRDGAAGRWIPARVSQRRTLGEAIFVTSQVDAFDGRGAGEAYKAIEREAWITRTWGDGYGYLLVATGRADVMVDPVVNAWDIAAIRPVIEEAGGRFTNWEDEVTSRGDDALGTNGHLHADVLRHLQAG